MIASLVILVVHGGPDSAGPVMDENISLSPSLSYGDSLCFPANRILWLPMLFAADRRRAGSLIRSGG